MMTPAELKVEVAAVATAIAAMENGALTPGALGNASVAAACTAIAGRIREQHLDTLIAAARLGDAELWMLQPPTEYARANEIIEAALASINGRPPRKDLH